MTLQRVKYQNIVFWKIPPAKTRKPVNLAMIIVSDAELRYRTRYRDEAMDCKPRNRGSIPYNEMSSPVQKYRCSERVPPSVVLNG